MSTLDHHADARGSGHTGAGRVVAILIALAVLLGVVALGRLVIGASSLGLPAWEMPAEVWWAIVEARATRLATGAVVGVALAVAGVALQALLRNPLAEPYILGLSTGAAAGVMGQMLLLYYLEVSIGVFSGTHQAGALLGAAASMFIVFAASRRRGVIDPLGLLLTGVVLGTINGALIMLLNYLAGPGGIRDDLARWMMGYLSEGVSRETIYAIGGIAATGLGVLLACSRSMDVATLSDAEAESLGVNLARLRTVLFLVASVLAAGAVVLAGPVAFVGLICPHLARLMLGPSHGPLLIGSALLGATLILLADTLSAALHWWIGLGIMPIGIFTAIVGGPVFLWMLHPQLGRGQE